MLAAIDQLVREAGDGVVTLNAVPKVYLDEDDVTFEPTDVEVPEPDDVTLLYLLGKRYPGVAFELPAEVPTCPVRDGRSRSVSSQRE